MVHLPAEGSDVAERTRVAYAVTKRVGSAVVRNRLRRRLRAVCSDLVRSRPNGLPPGALLISVGPEAVRRRSDELRNDVIRLLDELDARLSRTEASR